MKAVNLFILTRKIEYDTRALYEKALSNRDEEIKVRMEEIDMIQMIVDRFLSQQADPSVFENWFYSFTIPQIGKEFDLLKIGSDRIVNIELKSQEVALERIRRQLKQNRMYLKHICTNIYSFTAVGNPDGTVTLYRYEKDELFEASFDELLACISKVQEPLEDEIEKLFRPADYLISPINTPEKFLNGEYYLNNMQSAIKREIIAEIQNGKKLFGINGSAGTGKTLLLYDLAKELSGSYRICIIHSGILTGGHKLLDSMLENIDVVDAYSVSADTLTAYDIVCVDESQRLAEDKLDVLLETCEKGPVRACVFAFDDAQVLSKTEIRRDNPGRLRRIDGFYEQYLKIRIRSNPQMISFVRTLLRLYDIPRSPVDYSNVEVVYANDLGECLRILEIYQARGYTYISNIPAGENSKQGQSVRGSMNSGLIIGQEFDSVVQVMDHNFRYSEKGELVGKEYTDSDYLVAKMFYQNITRAREKMCIIVLNNRPLFEALLMIKEHKYTQLIREYVTEEC